MSTATNLCAVISLCVASSPVSLSAVSATSATANAQSAIPTFDLRPLCAFATSAASETTRTSVLYAAVRVSPTLSTVSSARASKRIVTGAPRL